jgi:septal ring factor EnvC (AmiA/AmiB activator)
VLVVLFNNNSVAAAAAAAAAVNVTHQSLRAACKSDKAQLQKQAVELAKLRGALQQAQQDRQDTERTLQVSFQQHSSSSSSSSSRNIKSSSSNEDCLPAPWL